MFCSRLEDSITFLLVKKENKPNKRQHKLLVREFVSWSLLKNNALSSQLSQATLKFVLNGIVGKL